MSIIFSVSNNECFGPTNSVMTDGCKTCVFSVYGCQVSNVLLHAWHKIMLRGSVFDHLPSFYCFCSNTESFWRNAEKCGSYEKYARAYKSS
jgi:hypothetical protein